MAFTKVTEQSSPYRHIEKMSVREIIDNINKEDHLVADAVQKDVSAGGGGRCGGSHWRGGDGRGEARRNN